MYNLIFSNKIFIVCYLALIFISCSNKYPQLQTVKNVNINKYLGTWYEIVRKPNRFEKDCKNVTANYSKEIDNIKENDKDKNIIKVINKCTKISTNKTSQALGEAYNIDKTNSKLKVSFFWPFWGDYHIIILDKDYKYVVVGEPSREYLWILARQKKLDKNIVDNILKKLKKEYKYNIKDIIYTIQE
jgi:apolipoprotein D and lipocalin family protein